MKAGLLGGSFDPIHFGHLNLAISLLEAHDLDRVLFCPTSRSPFKIEQMPLAPTHRLAMTRRALQGIDVFSLLDWEAQHSGPSYTIDTVKRWKAENPGELFLLLGEDQLPHLHHWKEVETLFTLCRPLIASREKQSIPANELSAPVQALIAQGRTKSPILEISSTQVRQRLKNGCYCGHLVPYLVLDYIQEHGLYS
jgi:nicotinate-nucleotide adenylyltransferase